MNNKAIVILKIENKCLELDLEIPLDITAKELLVALNTVCKLGIDTTDIKNCYLKTERPVALIKGNKTLAEYGICNGSVINYTR